MNKKKKVFECKWEKKEESLEEFQLPHEWTSLFEETEQK